MSTVARGKAGIRYHTVYDRRIANKDHSFRFCTGETNKKRADRVALLREKEILAGLARGIQPGKLRKDELTTARMCEIDQERFLTKPVTERQKENIRDHWDVIGSFITDYRNVDTHVVFGLYKFLRPRMANQSIVRYIQALRRTLKLAASPRYGYAVQFPEEWPDCSKFDRKKKSQAGRDTTREEIDSLLRRIARNPRLFTHLFLIVSTGLRFEEADKVTLDMVRKPNEAVPEGIAAILHVPEEVAKWGRARDIALTHEALEALRTLGPRPYVLAKCLRDNCRAIGMPTISARSGRHTVYRGTRDCGDVFAPKLMMGHKQGDSSDPYIHPTDLGAAKASLAQATYYGLPAVWQYRIAPGTFKGYVREKHAAGLRAETARQWNLRVAGTGTGTGHRYSTGTIVDLTNRKRP